MAKETGLISWEQRNKRQERVEIGEKNQKKNKQKTGSSLISKEREGSKQKYESNSSAEEEKK